MSIPTRIAQKPKRALHRYRNFFLTFFVLLSLSVTIILTSYLSSLGKTVKRSKYTALTLDNVNSLVVKQIAINSPSANPTNASCNYFNCFNIYRCGNQGNKLLVYVYPLKNYVDPANVPVTNQISKEFYLILQAIAGSSFYTSDPFEACLFIPSIDTLNQNRLRVKEVSQALKSLEFWNDGENHLIFNMIPGSVPDYNTVIDIPVSKAMIAGAGFSSLTYRAGFDVSLPVYSPHLENYKRQAQNRRNWLIISSQININSAFQQDLIEVKITFPNDLMVLGPCYHHNPMNSSIRCAGEDVYNYPDVLETGTFCLVIRGARLGQSSLLEAMAAGCIPVVIADSLTMPFHGVIDWIRAAIFVREVDILKAPEILKNVSRKRVVELRQHGTWLYERYFKSIQAITETTLEIMSDRVYPHLARDYNYWNVPQYPGIVPSLFLPVTAPKTRGFTAVILTYDRLESLFILITKLVKAPSLSKVLVIWNNQRKDPPEPSQWPKINRPLKVIQTKANKLSNRFYPYDEIETEAMLSIDDDIVMLTADELEFGFEVWREFPDRIVGFPSRTHIWDNSSICWKYESEWTNHISMVLTGAAFHHKYWSYMYTTSMPGDIKEWVDDHMNCEDIAMNFLVANMSGKPPIKVTSRKKFKCPECTNTEMLSADLNHMIERSQCINRFSSVYGTMPLKSVEFRADPVLYKDVFPKKLKRFNDIGSL
ncbi:exostosin-2 [Neodiprion virginianus]|uniref:exostosin-2 n=1 Tax=Neodiprion virginianus TaxID=2961670 RepID=UPI001EE762CC|nr:exostosin-2 [Neodiprion virginianus]